MKERLQKIIAKAGIASRRAAEELISSGHVSVGGVVVTKLGTMADIETDLIEIDGKVIDRADPYVYFLINKPKGYISTVKDERGRKTVISLLPKTVSRIYPVGRLDAATEGLLLLTNDGALTSALLHPGKNIWKTYQADVHGEISEPDLRRLREGVKLSDGMTLPAKVQLIYYNSEKDRSRIKITIHEGRNREVRRMCEALGHKVHSLKRTEFAGLTLAGVSRGNSRELTQEEVCRLYDLTGLGKKV